MRINILKNRHFTNARAAFALAKFISLGFAKRDVLIAQKTVINPGHFSYFRIQRFFASLRMTYLIISLRLALFSRFAQNDTVESIWFLNNIVPDFEQTRGKHNLNFADIFVRKEI